jgi:hypothetical protein
MVHISSRHSFHSVATRCALYLYLATTHIYIPFQCTFLCKTWIARRQVKTGNTEHKTEQFLVILACINSETCLHSMHAGQTCTAPQISCEHNSACGVTCLHSEGHVLWLDELQPFPLRLVVVRKRKGMHNVPRGADVHALVVVLHGDKKSTAPAEKLRLRHSLIWNCKSQVHSAFQKS